mmetsp:Transcript_116001/g.323074  ORF Transcript_116001/g.323074 Transcript_116001/m.323074 type:complete len:642 (+) Transcript_116001:82-2007(+)|eukprot:CAMPEP_0179118102 /NCGR_PEP_ID=MMETSP0796-20121207/55516_1 /TAXON_ID=73915 /ORGANISM="Pyrodinium bahamense, Strain pbaha01" /LENGTH=641 /DNA_ID=CAMNT_0020816521 /DNA_START=57 /DNA_END=1982 /DNA_ORIENTATION=+
MAASSIRTPVQGRPARTARTRTPSVPVLAVASLAITATWHVSSHLGFVGVQPTAAPVLRATAQAAGSKRPGLTSRRVEPIRDSEGRKIKTPTTFDASDASQVIGTYTAEFKKRPFGVLAYAPSSTGKGAMVWEMKELSRYPGDPQGQAFTAGVKKGYAVKAVAGQDVSTWDFWDIMDLLDDKILDNSAGKFQSGGQGAMGNQPAGLPLKVEYVQLKGAEEEVEESGAPVEIASAGYVDRSDPRYADLPQDATLVEYKIPPAPSSYSSPTVEAIRSYMAQLPEPVGYSGPRYTGANSINEATFREMMKNFKEGKLLPVKDAYRMAIDVFDILVKEKTLGRVSIPEGKNVTVVGDLHGQLWDFDHMLGLAGLPSPDNTFVFNGDFVDRGPWSVEVMFSLLALKLWHPNNVFMNRGNHEAEMANTFYGFFGEVEVKYEKKMTELFTQIFQATPLCHVINGEVFVVHGGIPGPDPRVWWKGIDNQISFDGRQIQISLDEIENSNRFMEPNPSDNPLMVDLLWSDPKGKDGYGPSGRMSSGIYLFGPDISRNFMTYNGLRMTIRSHEVKAQGYRYDHDGEYPLITVFSAPNYVDKAGNLASVAVLTNQGGKLQGPEFIQYQAQPHPDVPSGAYAVGGPLAPGGVPA